MANTVIIASTRHDGGLQGTFLCSNVRPITVMTHGRPTEGNGRSLLIVLRKRADARHHRHRRKPSA